MECEKYGIDIPEKWDERILSVLVRVISAETLIRNYAVTRIDLLQIDCEGYDYEVIKLFNIEINKPRVIIYENSHICNEDQIACESLLKKNGYAVKIMGPNTLAMQNPDAIFNSWFSN